MPSMSFRFGSDRQHTVRGEYGWFGGEKYFVDDALVLDLWSLKPSGIRRFTFNEQQIEVRLSTGLIAMHGRAFVDGECVAADLFVEFNAKCAKLFSFGAGDADTPLWQSGTAKLGLLLLCLVPFWVAYKYLA